MVLAKTAVFISLMLTRRFAQADPPDRATPKGHRI